MITPPKVKAVRPTIEARQGETVELECEVAGVPRPTVHWVKQVFQYYINIFDFN